ARVHGGGRRFLGAPVLEHLHLKSALQMLRDAFRQRFVARRWPELEAGDVHGVAERVFAQAVAAGARLAAAEGAEVLDAARLSPVHLLGGLDCQPLEALQALLERGVYLDRAAE